MGRTCLIGIPWYTFTLKTCAWWKAVETTWAIPRLTPLIASSEWFWAFWGSGPCDKWSLIFHFHYTAALAIVSWNHPSGNMVGVICPHGILVNILCNFLLLFNGRGKIFFFHNEEMWTGYHQDKRKEKKWKENMVAPLNCLQFLPWSLKTQQEIIPHEIVWSDDSTTSQTPATAHQLFGCETFTVVSSVTVSISCLHGCPGDML